MSAVHTDMSIEDTTIRGKVICADSERLLCSHKGKLKLYSLKEMKCIHKNKLPMAAWKRLASNFRVLERLLHTEIRCGVWLDKNNVILIIGCGIYCFNIGERTLIKEFSLDNKPLSALKVENINGFEDSVLIGDYGKNNERGPVNIYRRSTETGKWSVVYTFPAGKVRHIHGLFSDAENSCVYIATGDEDSESGIWKATQNFKCVEPLLLGKQQYRCCQIFPMKNEIIFLTDAPSEKNHIYIYSNNTLSQGPQIDGTCIYGVSAGNVFIGSTTVEPDFKPKNKFDYWLSNKAGSGINDNITRLILVTREMKQTVICGYEHDGLPLRLFQYGTVYVIYAGNNTVYFSPNAVKKYDGHIFKLDIGSIET